jgi:hypothetical protein
VLCSRRVIRLPVVTRAPKIAALICAGFLLAAVWGHWPAGFYTALRWIICGSSLYMAGKAADEKQRGWATALAITALVFNPLVPFHLYPESWRLLDGLVTLMMLLFAAYYAPDRESD